MDQVKFAKNNHGIFKLLSSTKESRYSRMGQVKFVEDNLLKKDHVTSNVFKAVTHKFYLIQS